MPIKRSRSLDQPQSPPSINWTPYIHCFFGSFLYYSYYVLSPVIWEYAFTTVVPNFRLFPPYVQHILIAFTAQTCWFALMPSDVFPDVAGTQFMLGQMTPTSLALQVLAMLLGAGIAGVIPSLAQLSNYFFDPRCPRLDAFFSYSDTVASVAQAFFSGNKLASIFYLEVFFSFIHAYATCTLVFSSVGKGFPSRGVSELKRFIGGTLVFLSTAAMGERASMNLAFTVQVASFYRDLRIVVFFGSANIFGFLAAYLMFDIQSSLNWTTNKIVVGLGSLAFSKAVGTTGALASTEAATTELAAEPTTELRLRRAPSRSRKAS